MLGNQVQYLDGPATVTVTKAHMPLDLFGKARK